ncbi:MAG: ParB/RepB/Spo0J family partition protein [Myxococcales bacterium]|nr:ParB/RepB/Spo0J family partition protein [Myxococcales bacterium]
MNAPLKRKALGRGLDALIPGGSGDATVRPVAAPRDYFRAPIEELSADAEQPRQLFDEARLEELAASIRAHGVMEPLVVRQRVGGGYTIIMGERRWRAAQRAGLREVPVVVREATAALAFEMAVVENLQREDLNAIEEAQAFRRLIDEFGYTQEKLALRIGKDRTTIANALRLLKLPPPVQQLLLDGALDMGHARALLGLEESGGAAAILALAKRTVAEGLSVRAVEALVRAMRTRAKSGAARSGESGGATGKTANLRDLEERLTRTLGAKISVRDRGGGRGGKIEIPYANLDELDRLLDHLLSTRRN